ncbi:MAG: glycoside hydrolase family 10 protein [Gemmatimonadaceae bacterium]
MPDGSSGGWCRAAVATAALIAALSPLPAQQWERGDLYAPRGAETDSVAPPLLREFRGAWLATVANIDWPSKPGLPADSQKAELRYLFDVARRARLNAVIFQVRPAADALYPSKLEPWSYFLTGAQGRAPRPVYDPLAFAVAEAHARGLELHTWFNPYRSRHPSDSSRRAGPSHVSRRNPAWNKTYGPYQWMDPGEPGVRKRTIDVILDVVRRYDIDGVHMDDYFYPYPERNRRGAEIPFPDARSWRAYRNKGGTLSRDDWRRKNVDDLVRGLYDAVKKEKPWVKVGISPFGIWRPGYPASVRGFDAYEKLYADSRRWLNEGWIDYFTPQLYWKLSAPQQPYADLLAWWRSENTHGRHLWPGNFTGRASAKRNPSWSVHEVFDQVQETRHQLGGLSGNVHFPLNAFVHNTDSLMERFEAGLYAEPALVPASPWLESGDAATVVVDATRAPDGIELQFARVRTAPPPAAQAAAKGKARPTRPIVPRARASDPRWWMIRARYTDGWRVRIVDAGQKLVRLAADPAGDGPAYVTVSVVDRIGRESPATIVTPP